MANHIPIAFIFTSDFHCCTLQSFFYRTIDVIFYKNKLILLLPWVKSAEVSILHLDIKIKLPTSIRTVRIWPLQTSPTSILTPSPSFFLQFEHVLFVWHTLWPLHQLSPLPRTLCLQPFNGLAAAFHSRNKPNVTCREDLIQTCNLMKFSLTHNRQSLSL